MAIDRLMDGTIEFQPIGDLFPVTPTYGKHVGFPVPNLSQLARTVERNQCP
jgi:hypothetical protein